MTEIKNTLKVLEKVCLNPEEYLENIRKEKKIIGCFLPYTPVELIYSMGFHPQILWWYGIETGSSSKYLPPFYCYPLKSLLEAGMEGKLDYLSSVLIASFCDSLKAIGQNWKVAVENIEFIPLVYPQNRDLDCSMDFLKSEFLNIIKILEGKFDCKYDENKLKEAIKLYNERNQKLNKLMDLANQHLDIITPKYRNYINKAGAILDVKDHTKYIDELIAGLEAREEFKSENKKVLLTGIMADSKTLLNAIEDCDLSVVSDDLAQESRQYRTEIKEYTSDPLFNLCKKWADFEGCSMAHSKENERVKIILEKIKENDVDGVIFVNTSFCDPEEYDYPIIKKALEEKNIPQILIESNKKNTSNGQIKTRIEAFQELLNS